MARNNQCFFTWINCRKPKRYCCKSLQVKVEITSTWPVLWQKPVLGKMVALLYVIEWQKWGPSHAHILGICDNANKPKTIAGYDSVVCGEILDKDIFPELHQIVTKFMMHEPCGVANPNSPCMEDGECKKHFPKISQKWQWSVMAIPNTGEGMMANM